MLILSGVHLGNDNIGIASDLLGQLNVDWGQLLTVSAPRSIGLQQDVLIGSQDQRLESLSDDDLDRLVVALGNGGRLIVNLELVILEVLEGLGESLLSQITHDELVQVTIVELDDPGGGAALDSDVLGESLTESL